MKIEILGMGCQKCNTLYETTKQAAEECGIDAEFEKVSDMKKIMGYGVMSTPALVVDGTVKVYGKLPTKDEIKAMLK